jgi:uncharacterized membrane protein YfcA
MEWLGAGVLDGATTVMLVIAAGFTSFLTAAAGIGGGVLLLAILASVLPVTALIPVHGLVQVGSNGNRTLMMWRHIDWSMVRYFSIGAVAGAVAASFIVVQLPLWLIQLSVALFILYLVWGPKPSKHEVSITGRVAAGAATTLVSMFVGATGPLVAGFVHRQGYDKYRTTSTFACCMTFQHLLKMGVFSVVGFAFWQWLPLVALMVLSGVVGTWAGLRLLHRIPGERFSQLFRFVVTLLALRLLWQALSG